MTIKECFAARLKDKGELLKSSSGGAFLAFATAVIQHGGCVFGCAWNVELKAEHIKVECLEDLTKLRGSKYVRSDASSAYGAVATELAKERNVLFSGTPCEIAALLQILKKKKVKSDRLVTVELICHGTPTPEVWSAFLRQAKKKIVKVDFKDKSTGWSDPTFHITYADGTDEKRRLYADSYVRAFETGMSIGKGCFACPFKSGRSGADLTIGDFWGGEEYLTDWKDDLGISCVVLNTKNGKAFWENHSGMLLQVPIQYDWISSKNPNIDLPPSMPNNWMIFQRQYPRRKMNRLVRHLLDGPLYVRVVRRVKAKFNRLCKVGQP